MAAEVLAYGHNFQGDCDSVEWKFASRMATVRQISALQVLTHHMLTNMGYADLTQACRNDEDMVMKQAREEGRPLSLFHWIRLKTGDCRVHAALLGSLMLPLKRQPSEQSGFITRVLYTYTDMNEAIKKLGYAGDHAAVYWEYYKHGVEEEDMRQAAIADAHNTQFDGVRVTPLNKASHSIGILNSLPRVNDFLGFPFADGADFLIRHHIFPEHSADTEKTLKVHDDNVQVLFAIMSEPKGLNSRKIVDWPQAYVLSAEQLEQAVGLPVAD
eukprot:gnl/TRDRNA2_/TRDRNA2_81596_c0_seq1.p1 gnl/TRDRNA2_/TRDRNA2_81596_c0~~gnl/TRDRNA2_/TRDRNA2_81596_c0_seq1.p1  ORF type:complete len:279 (-),score=22.54 gnl/TRDRNA2_/TRDRNA2_81596_c0_seq1:91-903(-)